LRARCGSSFTSSAPCGGTRFTTSVRRAPSSVKWTRSSSASVVSWMISSLTSVTSVRRLREMKLVSGSGARSSPTGRLVDRAVHERVREGVQLARDVLDAPRREAREQLAGAQGQWPQPRVLDLPPPVHLLHDEERVHAHVELVDAAAKRFLEADDQGGVFGDVVRGVTERAHELGDDLAPLVEEDRTGAGRPGVPARAAVGVQGRAGHARKPARRSGSTFPPDTIATTRSPGRGFTAPLSS